MRTLALILAAALLHAQEAGTFHAGTRQVPIYATVVDRRQQIVTDLTQADFEVRDNGAPVSLTVFSAEPAPIALAMLLDTSGSMQPYLPLVVGATEQLIDRLDPRDETLLGTFGERTIFAPHLTSDRDELLRFLHTRVRAGGQTPLWNAIDIGMIDLKDATARRVVLVFTDGFDTTTFGHGFDAVSKHAESLDVMVYAVGCWGGPGSGDEPPDSDLRKMAERTGGGYKELTWAEASTLPATFARISDELHHQYVLGFTPAKLDGRTHALEVRVKKPGLTVRARKSYVAN